jgi:hypothetical protein
MHILTQTEKTFEVTLEEATTEKIWKAKMMRLQCQGIAA